LAYRKSVSLKRPLCRSVCGECMSSQNSSGTRLQPSASGHVAQRLHVLRAPAQARARRGVYEVHEQRVPHQPRRERVVGSTRFTSSGCTAGIGTIGKVEPKVHGVLKFHALMFQKTKLFFFSVVFLF
jgi:hypothetical protein